VVLADVPLSYCQNAYEVAEGCDALVIVTDWNEFKSLNMQRIRAAMRQPVLIDGRNIYEPQEMLNLGFIYRGIGRSAGIPLSLLNSNGSTGETGAEPVSLATPASESRES
jgi:UDPglucose 6-dehydrogenase